MNHEYTPSKYFKNRCFTCGQKEKAHYRKETESQIDLNPSDEKLREMIAEKDREITDLKIRLKNCAEALAQSDCLIIQEKDREIAMLEMAISNRDMAYLEDRATWGQWQKDAERYRKLKARFNKSAVMSNGRRWWDCSIATEPEFENLDQVADWLSEGK